MSTETTFPEVFQASAFIKGAAALQRPKFKRFLSKYMETIAHNVKVYSNVRARESRYSRLNADNDGKTRAPKILSLASAFIPAHSSRWKRGFDLTKVTHFVVHRPGNYPNACTFRQVIKEFSVHHRAASTHFVISYTGDIVQMVDLNDKAFHCGKSPLLRNGNTVAIGVELEGAVGQPFTPEQYGALAQLLVTLVKITNIDLKADPRVVVGHSEIRPRVKKDPGPNFNYAQLLKLTERVPPDTGPIFNASFDYSVKAVLAAIIGELDKPDSLWAAIDNARVLTEVNRFARSVELSNMSLPQQLDFTSKFFDDLRNRMATDSLNAVGSLEAVLPKFVLPVGVGFDFESEV